MTCRKCEHLGVFGRGSINFTFCKHPNATQIKEGKTSYKTILDVDEPINCPWEEEYQKKIRARLSKKRKRY